MATIGLSMIVKDEAKLILRCLESVRPLVDYACICDTGSTDGTQEIIRNFLREHSLEGEIIEDPWIDFAANRNRALLALNRRKIDYAFVIDADDSLEISPVLDLTAFKDRMDKDVYDVTVQHVGLVHARPQIFRNKPGYRWVGVLHEYLEPTQPFTREIATGLLIKASTDGGRSTDPEKYRKDAEILKTAIKTENNAYLRARYTFYAAQSYRDAQDYENALKYYIECSKMGFWDEQVYVALFEAIRCCTKIDCKLHFTTAKEAFDHAVKTLPGRVEADHAMSFLYRQIGKNREGMETARRGLGLALPDGLFMEPWIYDYALRDEFAVNAYWAGHHLESLQANLVLLASIKTPPGMVKRLADNAIAALAELKLAAPVRASYPTFPVAD